MRAPPILRLGIVALTAALAGCEHVPDVTDARQLYLTGMQAEASGDDLAARADFAAAYEIALKGSFGEGFEAQCLYEYAREAGYTGEHEKAEKAFRDTLTLLDRTSVPPAGLRSSACMEFARFLHDTRQHAKAIPAFEKALPEMRRQGMLDVDPVGYAAFLDDFADSLTGAGQAARAAEVSAESAALKARHKGEKPYFDSRRYWTAPPPPPDQ